MNPGAPFLLTFAMNVLVSWEPLGLLQGSTSGHVRCFAFYLPDFGVVFFCVHIAACMFTYYDDILLVLGEVPP